MPLNIASSWTARGSRASGAPVPGTEAAPGGLPRPPLGVRWAVAAVGSGTASGVSVITRRGLPPPPTPPISRPIGSGYVPGTPLPGIAPPPPRPSRAPPCRR